jgi:hypothetical protein
MNVSREEKKNEAIRRMKKMKYWGRAREAFRRQNKVFVSEPPFGAVYDPEPDVAEQIKEFEEQNNALVYMVVRAFTCFGVMDSFVYVSDYPEEWEMDDEDIENGIVMTYTINKDAPECSEFGSIGFRMGSGAGMIRGA